MEKTFKLNKKEFTAKIEVFPDIETLLTKESAEWIIGACAKQALEDEILRLKKLHKPKRVTKNEKRNSAFNSLSAQELQELEDNPNKFEEIIDRKIQESEEKTGE